MTKGEIELEEHLHFLLCERKFNTILDILKSPDNDVFVSENIWSLINTICLTIKSENLLKNDANVTSCKKILLLLVNRGNPKEVLVSLLEQADSFKGHEFFCMLLDPLQRTLQKSPGKRGKSLQWVLSVLNAHIVTLGEPEDLDLQGEEKILLDADPAVQDATYVLSNYLPFITFFVDEVSFENLKKKEIHYIDRIFHQQELLHRYILKLFYQPLLFHDLHVLSDSRPKSTVRKLCEGYVECLSKICCNVFNLFKYDSNNKDIKDSLETSADEDAVPSLAFSNLSYLIFVENIALDFQPFVYSHLFIFMKNLKYITFLLQSKQNVILFKGLHLAQRLLIQLDNLQLNYDCTELEVFIEFSKLLLDIAILCKFDTLRKLSIKIFLGYITKCNYKGRYHLIMQTLSTVNHSGAEGVVICKYKEFLHEALNDNTAARYFLGKNFSVFVKKVFILCDGVETDIVEHSDRILTSLNFLRYILLRDTKEMNLTGIWDLVSFISESFIKPLTTGLDFSRAHYKQVILDAENERRNKKTLNTTVTCDNEILPNVPVNFHKDVFQKALMTFDVIESILARVKELISE